MSRGSIAAAGAARTIAAALLAAAILAGCGASDPGVPFPVALPASGPATGPLRALPGNACWFATPSGRAVLLTGAHTWNTLQDWGPGETPPVFDWDAYLDWLVAHGHDFVRLYAWEQAAGFPGCARTVRIAPLPWARTGPGLALDGRPRFDLARLDTTYFHRLRARVRDAGARGIWVSVMLFDGWSVEGKGHGAGNPWRGHPFNAANNVNGIDGDRDHDGEGREVHTLADTVITALQGRYLAAVVAAVGDLPNVLYEVSNESDPGAIPWERDVIRRVRALEAARGVAHPIGFTAPFPRPAAGNAPLFESGADWVSPFETASDRYEHDPPAASGRGPVVLTDTDHLWGVGGTPAWVWKSFLRGLNPIFMDPYTTPLRDLIPYWPDSGAAGADAPPRVAPEWEQVRDAMGLARAVSERVDLAALRPAGALASSRYCLAAPGREYLVYLPSAHDPRRHRGPGRWLLEILGHETVEIELSAARGRLDVTWLDVGRARLYRAAPLEGGARRRLRAPFAGPALLHLATHDAARADAWAAGAAPATQAGGAAGR